MASYRQFPSQSTFPPPPPPPPPPPQQQQQQRQHQQRPNQYNQMHNFSQHYPPPPPPHQQYPYQPPPPPPPDSSYPPPPPPPPAGGGGGGYYPPSQYGHQPLQQPMQPPPPPLPSSPPPTSSIPPPPPPPSSPPPPPPPPKESGSDRDKGVPKERREVGHSNHGGDFAKHKQQSLKPPPAVPHGAKKLYGPSGRVETEEERVLRKKKEFERQRQEEKHRQQLKESQNSILQKTQLLSAQKGHGSIVGSRMGDRRTTPLLGGERIENRLKKPTTFLCKMKFRNELPDPSAQPKLMTMKRDKDRFTKYTITSLEKMYKPQLFVEADLGIPLDLLDLSVYNPKDGPRPVLDPEDEELLRDDEAVTPIKREGLKIKDRPTDKGVSWLVKTQYISSLSTETTKQSMNEKQAKEQREKRGDNRLENHKNRESQIKEIIASFEACKRTPVHATNKNLKPVEILPLLPDFDRYEDKFVLMTFDNAPTADSEIYSKLDSSVREACESRAVMKACVAKGSDPSNPEKFLAYMAPSPNELSKDMYDENEDILYTWIREYHWDVLGDDANDPTTFLVSFDEDATRYVPLPTKINLKKKRAREGRSGDEVEHFPAPSSVTVKRRPTAAARELVDSGGASTSRGNIQNSRMGTMDDDEELGRLHRVARDQDIDHSSEAEDDLSE